MFVLWLNWWECWYAVGIELNFIIGRMLVLGISCSCIWKLRTLIKFTIHQVFTIIRCWDKKNLKHLGKEIKDGQATNEIDEKIRQKRRKEVNAQAQHEEEEIISSPCSVICPDWGECGTYKRQSVGSVYGSTWIDKLSWIVK